MSIEELTKFLQEHLKIEVGTDRDGDIKVTLFLCEKEISTSWTPLILPHNNPF